MALTQIEDSDPAPLGMTPVASVTSVGEWREAVAEMTRQVSPPVRHEQVTIAAAVGRVLAEGCAGTAVVPTGTLVEWAHLPLLVEAGCRTLSVYPRLRAGIVTLSDPTVDEATAALLAAVFEGMGGQSFVTSSRGPASRLCLSLEMFANRCELIFVVGDLGPHSWPALKSGTTQGGLRCFRVGSTLVLLMPPRLPPALVDFTAFAVPVIRKLQGRREAQLVTRLAYVEDPQCNGMSLVREQIEGDRLALSGCDETPAGLALANGVAWRPTDVPSGTLAYMPFEDWLC